MTAKNAIKVLIADDHAIVREGLRVVLSTLILCPLGIALGMAMPLGLRRFAARHPESVAYAWGVNGVASSPWSSLTTNALHTG